MDFTFSVSIFFETSNTFEEKIPAATPANSPEEAELPDRPEGKELGACLVEHRAPSGFFCIRAQYLRVPMHTSKYGFYLFGIDFFETSNTFEETIPTATPANSPEEAELPDRPEEKEFGACLVEHRVPSGFFASTPSI